MGIMDRDGIAGGGREDLQRMGSGKVVVTGWEAYDSLDPIGNITIKWDILQWTPDGYSALVTINNFQQYRHIQPPGWTLGWTWVKKEVIWSMVGAQTTEQGDCSKFKGNIPHCCKKEPSVVDLLPGTPYNMQIANCCKGGVISSWVQDSCNAISAFQLSVGAAGSTNKTVRPPSNFTLKAPGPGGDSPYLSSVVGGPGKNSLVPLVQCTSHMCPVRVHWHVKLNYKEYWRVKLTVTNFNYRMNYTQWNLVAQHPNFDNLTRTFSFNYKSITPYGVINDTAMFWGVKYYNDLLVQAGPSGNVQSEVLFRKDASTFTFQKGWAFPRRVYFNGDNCVMPPPDSYPWLPNASSRSSLGSFLLLRLAVLSATLGKNSVANQADSAETKPVCTPADTDLVRTPRARNQNITDSCRARRTKNQSARIARLIDRSHPGLGADPDQIRNTGQPDNTANKHHIRPTTSGN
ncbi:COBRA-like protein 1 [Platanthera zijinensis]|uniref:COBRA-like protein 1 n=1 Tax=Platanthera zijinensis TaxID=2320716 RepID=A0AAP0BKP6_9ASPA